MVISNRGVDSLEFCNSVYATDIQKMTLCTNTVLI